MMRVEIRGLARLARKLNFSDRDRAIRRGLTQSAFNIQSWIMVNRLTGPRPQYLGVVTNRLRASIAVQTGTPGTDSNRIVPPPIEKSGENYYAKIGTNVFYAAVHEFGLEGRRARPFMKPALEDRQNQADTLKILTRNLQEALNRAK